MLFLNIFKILKISFWTFRRKNCISLVLWALFSLKQCKTFRIAQCKKPRLVKPCLNSDLYFIFLKNLWHSFTWDNSFLQTPPSLSHEYRKTLPLALLKAILSPKSNKLVGRLWMQFSSISKSTPPFSAAPLFRRISQASSQDQQNGKRIYCRLPP